MWDGIWLTSPTLGSKYDLYLYVLQNIQIFKSKITVEDKIAK